jgi:DNA processing protein
MEAFGSVDRVRGASAAEVARVKGIGTVLCEQIVRGLRDSDAELARELERIDRAGVRLVRIGTPAYPSLLASIPGAPPLLLVRGRIDAGTAQTPGPDAYPIAIVGSRSCTAYGIEQAERFAGLLAGSGLTIVSGGALGIDTAAHRGAIKSGGRTIAVLGCGLSRVYPPENAELFDRIVAEERGAIVSELPMTASPDAKNFPARNRIVSGLSLGALVIEAAEGSGALITAKFAAEDHGREVMAVPGRIDSSASRGSNQLIRDNAAHAVLDPADVLGLLEADARHAFAGTHAHATRDPTRAPLGDPDPRLFDAAHDPTPGAPHNTQAARSPAHPPARPSAQTPAGRTDPRPDPPSVGTPLERAILAALALPRTPDELADAIGTGTSEVRAALTLLELRGQVRRAGSRVERT